MPRGEDKVWQHVYMALAPAVSATPGGVVTVMQLQLRLQLKLQLKFTNFNNNIIIIRYAALYYII
jgi:hypothetical protein